jgi:CBS domain containing-hemolysin-like protein
VLDASMVRPLIRIPSTLPLPDALTRLRRNKSHLALVTDGGAVTAMVTLEDLVEDLVGTVRDGTHRI